MLQLANVKKTLCSILQIHNFTMSIACIVNPGTAHPLSSLVVHLLKRVESRVEVVLGKATCEESLSVWPTFVL